MLHQNKLECFIQASQLIVGKVGALHLEVIHLGRLWLVYAEKSGVGQTPYLILLDNQQRGKLVL